MEAYLIGKIGDKVRIYDRTPGAKVRLYDYDIEIVRKAVESGKIQIEEATASSRGLLYKGRPVGYILFRLETLHSKFESLYAMDQVYEGPNKYTLECIDIFTGERVDIDALDYIKNYTQSANKIYNVAIVRDSSRENQIYYNGYYYGLNQYYEMDRLLKVVARDQNKVIDCSKRYDTDTPITVTIPLTIDMVLNHNKNIAFEIEPRDYVSGALFNNFKTGPIGIKEIRFKGEVGVIAQGVINSRRTKYTLPTKATTLLENSITQLKIDNINLLDYDETVIRSGVLRECDTISVILPKNTQSINKGALLSLKCNSIYFPSTIQFIDREVLNRTKILEAYVKKDSYIHTELKKSKIKVKVFNTDEEAYSTLLKEIEPETDDTFIKKLKLVYGGSDDPIISEIMSPEKIDKSKQLLKIYNEISKTKTDTPQDIVRLETSKLSTGISLQDLESNKVTDFLLHNINKINKPNDELSNTFKILCNLITRCSNSLNEILTIDYLNTIFGGGEHYISDTDVGIEVIDNRSQIVFIKDTVNLTRYRSNTFNLLFIIINGVIVYVTLMNTPNMGKPNFIDIIQSFNNTRNIPPYSSLTPISENQSNASKLLSTLDIIKNSESIVNKVEIPRRLNEKLRKTIANQLLAVVPSKKASKSFKTVSLIDGSLIQFEGEGSTDFLRTRSFKTSGYFNCTITRKVDHTSWSKSDIRMISEYLFDTEENVTRFKQIVLGSDRLDYLKSLPTAYDPLKPCIEWELSREFSNKGVREAKDILKLGYSDIVKLFDTAYFSKATPTLVKDNAYGGKKRFSLNDGTTILIQRIDTRWQALQMVGFISRMCYIVTSPNNKVSYYVSNMSIEDIMESIIGLYDPTTTKYGYIVPLDIEHSESKDFAIVYSGEPESKKYRNNYVYIVVNKSTGNIYLVKVSLKEDTTYQILFRYKDMHGALESQMFIPHDKYGKKSAYKYVDYVNLVNMVLREDVNFLLKIRNYILEGYPNGYTPTSEVGLAIDFPYFAKQPQDAWKTPLKGLMGELK